MIARLARRTPFTLIVALTSLWLVLQQSLAPSQVLLGVVIAVLLAAASSPFPSLRAQLRRLDVLAVLLLVFVREVVRSNLSVAGVVLGSVRGREARAGFVRIPLELRSGPGLAALAVIVTSTPGTVWAGLSPDGQWLTLHVLDLKDEQQWVHYIKHHFERRLREIFE